MNKYSNSTMTIEKAIEERNFKNSSAGIFDDFVSWLEDEIICNLLSGHNELAKFNINPKRYEIYYKNKGHELSQDIFWELISDMRILIYTKDLCDKYGFKFELNEVDSISVIKVFYKIS